MVRPNRRFVHYAKEWRAHSESERAELASRKQSRLLDNYSLIKIGDTTRDPDHQHRRGTYTRGSRGRTTLMKDKR